jgi:hypothetical protein
MELEELLPYLQEPRARIMGLTHVWCMVTPVTSLYFIALRGCGYVTGRSLLQEVVLNVMSYFRNKF